MPTIAGKITNRSLDNGAIDDYEIVGGYKVVQTHDELIQLQNIELYSVINPTEEEIKAELGKHILTNGSAVYVVSEKATYRWNTSQKQFVKDTSLGGSSGSNVVVDDELSENSTNPVQNKVVTDAIGKKQNTLTAGNNIQIENDVISADIKVEPYTYAGGAAVVGDTLILNDRVSNGSSGSNVVVDDELSENSTNPVQNKVITAALDNKLNKEIGKGLSTNDFTDDLKTKLENIDVTKSINITVDEDTKTLKITL